MLSCDIYRGMLKRIARYFENHNESYRAIACTLSSDVNEVSCDKILHRSMLANTVSRDKILPASLDVNEVSRDDIFTSLTLFCFVPASIYHQF